MFDVHRSLCRLSDERTAYEMLYRKMLRSHEELVDCEIKDRAEVLAAEVGRKRTEKRVCSDPLCEFPAVDFGANCAHGYCGVHRGQPHFRNLQEPDEDTVEGHAYASTCPVCRAPWAVGEDAMEPSAFPRSLPRLVEKTLAGEKTVDAAILMAFRPPDEETDAESVVLVVDD